MIAEVKYRRPEDGNAYGRPPATHDAEITEVGPGTPCGELLRRYWHPISLSENVTTTPQEVRLLGEDLIVFRDGQGRPGALLPNCVHRGTSLFYGKVDEDGIRCCYHGWKFDVQGRCLDQPCEPERGRNRDRVRQPWYPVKERYGLLFVYMGPPEKQPLLPRWDVLEELGSDEKLHSADGSFSVGGDDSVKIIPWNWLQDWENNLDPAHVQVLHSTFSENQFAPELSIMPKVTFERFEQGVLYKAFRELPDGRKFERVNGVIFPNVMSTPDVRLHPGQSSTIAWVVPVDDTHHRRFHVMRIPADMDPAVTRPRQMYVEGGRPRPWIEMTAEERQKWPGDWEAQSSQGPIARHSEERLGTTDQGIVMLRRLLRQEIHRVRDGEDPMLTSFDEDENYFQIVFGNFFEETSETA